MKSAIRQGAQPVVSHSAGEGRERKTWSLIDKLLLGLTPRQYLDQALKNPFNWILGIIFAIGLPLIAYRFLFGLGVVTHSSNDYPWGLFLGFGLFAMVPCSASGFMLGTTVEIFGRHDFEPVERLALLNGLLGYFFAVVYLIVDLGMPWRLPYPMVVAFGPAAVLFLVAWHVATYLSVQIAEVSVAFFEWIGWLGGKRFIRRIAVGLTVAGIILSTLHQGALGALFTYAPGKVHPLWYSAAFQWIHFFCSAIPAGLCMVIVVSTVVKKTMAWRCDSNFLDNLDRCTIGLAKGASMGLITYLVIKLIGVAHDNEWGYLATGWGAWFLLELAVGVVLPLVIFAWAIANQRVGMIRFAAAVTVFGIVLNRLNTAIIAFNWQSYQEIPHIFEVLITITVFAIYIVVYRFILYRLPILFVWKEQPEEATAGEAVRTATAQASMSNPTA
jgi:Ni/Fe-hydrogenase subunit HybB-like protein